MKRKVLINTLVSLLIPFFFMIRWLPNIYAGIIHGEYRYYDYRVNSFWELLSYVYGGWTYPIGAIVGGLVILLPFQLIKDGSEEKGTPLSFIKKWWILSGIVLGWVLAFGSISNIWTTPWWHNFIYPVFALIFGFVFNTLLYFGIDRYVEEE